MNKYVVAAIAACSVTFAGTAFAGNGAINGGCYNLQIIGSKTKNVDMTGTSGHSLFVLMNGNTKILLQEGAFGVIDRNGTDGSASFSLPNPDPTNSGTTAYTVYARLVGKPGTGIDMTTCASDPLDPTITYCSQESVSMSRIAGTSKFVNVSQQLLYIYADIDGDGTIDRMPLFDSRLADYYWDVDTQGRAHAQLKFCPVSTTVR